MLIGSSTLPFASIFVIDINQPQISVSRWFDSIYLLQFAYFIHIVSPWLFLAKVNPSFLNSDLASCGLNPQARATRFSSPRSRIWPFSPGLRFRYSLMDFIINPHVDDLIVDQPRQPCIWTIYKNWTERTIWPILDERSNNY
jgi:hypothetical protein